ncbi:hypothetical protein IEO21_05809 [Rhodonia placenta]|uniref:Uncharacterized protein n=1 Tax=Rhodonia placenta TaxID=104341 RepID=A0A8H7P154_9APHY|nr:hypothetical protein IEO21_05809 [Postia placenta]
MISWSATFLKMITSHPHFKLLRRNCRGPSSRTSWNTPCNNVPGPRNS